MQIYVLAEQMDHWRGAAVAQVIIKESAQMGEEGGPRETQRQEHTFIPHINVSDYWGGKKFKKKSVGKII